MQQDSQARLPTPAGVSDLDPQTLSNLEAIARHPEMLRRVTSSVSNLLEETISALRLTLQSVRQDTHLKIQESQATNVATTPNVAGQLQDDSSGTPLKVCNNNQDDIQPGS